MHTSSGLLLFASFLACSTQRGAIAPNGDSRSGATLPYIEDDYPRALAEARARHVPIFVETWAPW